MPGVCTSGQCFDEVLVQAMEALVRQPGSDLFVVLHQLGNHGPAYYRRYPRAFRHFAPACETDAMHQCSQEEIVNAYHNAVRYTDHVVARVIAFLSGSAIDTRLQWCTYRTMANRSVNAGCTSRDAVPNRAEGAAQGADALVDVAGVRKQSEDRCRMPLRACERRRQSR